MLTKIAIKRPVSVILIVCSLFVFGISSIFGFQLKLIPDMEMPMLITLATYAGADAQSVDELVTSVIEDAGGTISGVNYTMVRAYENYGLVIFVFDYGTDLATAHDDLRAALETAALTLPDDVDTPTIIEMNMNAADVIDISAVEVGDVDLSKVVNDDIVPQLEAISGTAQVSVNGDAEEYISVRLNSSLMNEYGLTMSSISSALAACDFNYPGGTVKQGSQDVTVSTSLEYNTAQLLKQTPITTSKGQVIQLQDVADVLSTTEDKSSVSRYNGQENLSIGVQAKTSYGTVNVCNDVKEKLEEIQEQNPAIEFNVTYDASSSILGSLKAVGETLLLGVLFSMLVLFLFFGDLKASLIVGASMPISLMTTLVLMSLMGFSMNLVTMTALVIAIGMMVDSSIVVIESCFRKREEEEDIKKVAEKGAKEVGASIIASTITTIVVYLPMATMDSLSGQMFSELSWTIVFAMVASLVSAIMLVPLFYTIFKPVPKEDLPIERVVNKIKRGYRWILPKLLYKKKTVLLSFVGMLILSFFIATTLTVEMIPASDEGMVALTMTFRTGTTLEKMDEVLMEWEQFVSEDPDVESYTASAGSGGMDSLMSSGDATITATLKDDRKRSTSEIVDEWNKKAAEAVDVDITASASGSSMSSYMSTDSYEISLESTNLQDLKDAANLVTTEIRKLDGVTKCSNSLAAASTMAKVEVDPLKAMQFGIAPVQVGMEIANVLGGVEANTITRDGEEYDIMVEYPEGEFDDLNKLLNITMTSPYGTQVPIRDIATVVYTDTAESIEKTDGKYDVDITVNASEQDLQYVQKSVDKLVDSMEFEGDVQKTDSLQTERQNEELMNIFKAILTAIFLVFLVMAMQFESPRFSLMVMTSIPFALIGSFLLLRICNSSLSMVSMMGFLMLMGIVVNNGILYVDTANMLRQQMPLEQALVESGVIRMRPILMTTLTTILSMVPMSLGLGENGAIMQGMALVIIGGLVASTILSLILIPTFYLILDNRNKSNDKKSAGSRLKKHVDKAKGFIRRRTSGEDKMDIDAD